ncbi:hypothetical protein COV13_03340 [Candidatus Woesearchaeota archaeon CG10_big_fil_rev_8_21_14_0_10_32_9]|nr:MAG: hypothetical protein COV13_03340 [Candidatus Woesearchaeota archaeon CG10_big_fil_rev_8_21_14_0_10_32_9]
MTDFKKLTADLKELQTTSGKSLTELMTELFKLEETHHDQQMNKSGFIQCSKIFYKSALETLTEKYSSKNSGAKKYE